MFSSGILVLAFVVIGALIIVAVKQSESPSSNYNERVRELSNPTNSTAGFAEVTTSFKDLKDVIVTSSIKDLEDVTTSIPPDNPPSNIMAKEAPSDIEEKVIPEAEEETFQNKLLKLFNLVKSCHEERLNKS